MTAKKYKRFIFWISLLLLIPCTFLGVIYFQLTKEAAALIEKGAVDEVISSESPVYYDDGSSLIGVFFDKTHRQYIPYPEIPKLFVKAIVAAEDRDFFRHRGFQLKAMLRALLANIRAGKVVQGGSTITQQTAKNIFKREKRSYLAKIKELVQAFLLETEYSKEKILEMYINQFFVTGAGKGLGIAARYFFDKQPKALDLVEAAFIAGSVKGPNRYNPFIKKSEKEREETRRLAKLRKDYVLAGMLKANFISDKEYLEAKDKDIPFKEGRIAYRLNVVLDYVREQLESDYFKRVLAEQGLENIATSGIRIYTSLNKEIQEAALTSLRRHLPPLDVSLSGYDLKRMVETYQEFTEVEPGGSEDNLPFLARIIQINPDGEEGYLICAWEQGSGSIDYEGLRPMGEAWLRWKSGSAEEFGKQHLPAFLENFRLGDLVPVRLASIPPETEAAQLTLSEIPELQGGIVVLQRGTIKAMVGGFFDRFFNRAADAKRQLGSIFKPIVYTAAVQLKWNSLDALPNRRDLFRFENTVYVPRPDHTPQSDRVSMIWAGAKSENLATVWLLYHLTDHLSLSEFKDVAALVGLARRGGEPYREYQARIRDIHGVVVNNEALMEAAFEEAKKDVESDIIFGGYEEVLDNVRRLHFSIRAQELDLEAHEGREIFLFNFQRLLTLNLRMKDALQRLQGLSGSPDHVSLTGKTAEAAVLLRNFYRTASPAHSKVVYTEQPEWFLKTDLVPVTPQWWFEEFTVSEHKEVWIEGVIPAEVIAWLQETLKSKNRELSSRKPYDMEVLYSVRDFRTLVNLSYVVYLSKELGISTELDPVLSFPLGANSISILEAALAYQTMITGNIYPVSSRENPWLLPLITKIMDRDNEVIWEYQEAPRQILLDTVSALVREILRKVMELGTGVKARDAVRLSFGEGGDRIAVPVPSFGKTGTSNRFTNSSFVGFVPAPSQHGERLEVEPGYVIAAYVGYDNNRPMKTEQLAIYGASGALPIWIDTANAIVNRSAYKRTLHPADLVFEPLAESLLTNGELRKVPVSPLTGLPQSELNTSLGSLQTWVFADAEKQGDRWDLKRVFRPVGRGER